MSDISPQGREPVRQSAGRNDPVFVGAGRGHQPQQLADVLERVLDKGIVIVGDIQVRLLDIELLTIKIRLMVASVDRAREMGINWWEGDPFVANLQDADQASALEQRVNALEQKLTEAGGSPASIAGGGDQRGQDQAQQDQEDHDQEQEADRGQRRGQQ